MGRVKMVGLAVLALLIASSEVRASCKDISNKEKCFDLESIELKAATPEEARRLIGVLKALGPEEIAKSCLPNQKMKVTEVIGAVCGEGRTVNRLCQFSGSVNCTSEGKLFNMDIAGDCEGGANDCGTFKTCVKGTIACAVKSSERTGPSRFLPPGFIPIPPSGTQPEQKGVAR
jgi:hypothetical protein